MTTETGRISTAIAAIVYFIYTALATSAIEEGLIQMTVQGKLTSRNQRYIKE